MSYIHYMCLLNKININIITYVFFFCFTKDFLRTAHYSAILWLVLLPSLYFPQGIKFVCIINEYYLLYFNLGIQKQKDQINETLMLKIKMYKSMHDEYLVCNRLP